MVIVVGEVAPISLVLLFLLLPFVLFSGFIMLNDMTPIDGDDVLGNWPVVEPPPAEDPVLPVLFIL